MPEMSPTIMDNAMPLFIQVAVSADPMEDEKPMRELSALMLPTGGW